MNSKALHIHIERLVVDGLHASQQRQFVCALEAQLEAQLPELASQAFAGRRPALRISRVVASPMRVGTTPERAASHVTDALRGAITGKGNPRA